MQNDKDNPLCPRCQDAALTFTTELNPKENIFRLHFWFCWKCGHRIFVKEPFENPIPERKKTDLFSV